MRQLGLVVVVVGTVACSSSSSSGFGSTSDAGAPGHDAGSPADVSTVPVSDTGSGGGGGSSGGTAVVYGHSGETLYAVDPTSKAVSVVGDFSGCDSSVIDIALDKTSQMYATTYGGVYTVNSTTAACSLIATGSYPNSLSFVPAGTLDPNVEALVGYNGSTYVRIDTTTGALTNVGSLSGGYQSSGDIVSVIGGGTYLTVTGGNGCSKHDCLVEVDPKTGDLLKNYGSVGYSSVFGLAFWAGTVYGFDSGGDLFQVTFPSTGGITVTAIPIPNKPSKLSFYGAGSTTSAPPIPASK